MREQILGYLLGARWGGYRRDTGDEVDVEVHIPTNEVLAIERRAKQLMHVPSSLVDGLVVALARLATLAHVSLQVRQGPTFLRLDSWGNYLLQTLSEIAIDLLCICR